MKCLQYHTVPSNIFYFYSFRYQLKIKFLKELFSASYCSKYGRKGKIKGGHQ